MRIRGHQISIGGDQICRQGKGAFHTRKRADRHASEASRKDALGWQRPVQRAIRIVQPALVQQVSAGERRFRGMDHVGAELIEKDSIAATQAAFPVAEHIPGEADARPHIVQIVEAQLAIAGHARVAREQDARQRIRMHCRAGREAGNIARGVAMEFLVPCQVRFPSSSVGQRQPGVDFEFVLEVEAVFPLDRVAARLAELDAHLVEGAEQKIRHRVTGSDAAEGDAAGLREPAV